jgi:hypothetical protein
LNSGLSDEDRARYFQEISRAFIERRGAPFLLSSRDIDLLSSWEKAGLPLSVVLEGIDLAFEPGPGRSGARGRAVTLAFCRAQVERAFERHRDRRVGNARKTPPPTDKRERARTALELFLADLPDAVPLPVIGLSREARKILSADPVDADALERLDAQTEAALLDSAEAAEEGQRAQVRAGAGAEKNSAAGNPARTRLVKSLREKFRVPYFSLFYY